MDMSKCRQRAREYIDSFSSTELLSRPSSIPKFNDFKSVSFHRLVGELDMHSHIEDVQHTLENIIMLKGYLAETVLPKEDESTEDALATIRASLLSAILPSKAFAYTSTYAASQAPQYTSDKTSKYHVMSSNALTVLEHLYIEYPTLEEAESDTIAFLTSTSSFTDLGDPWTCEASQKVALRLLDFFMNRRDFKDRSHALSLLSVQKIKPAFSKTRNTAVTQQARKAVDPLPMYSSASAESDGTSLPWKSYDPSVTTILGWIIGSLGLLDSSFVKSNWPLLIPPLLALIDDSSAAYQAKGCAFLNTLLHRTPSLLLHQTGLGEVLENSLMPCLMYLPSMTQETESLSLLREAYPALISLARVRFQERQERSMKTAAMERILRNGILKGYGQAGEHVKIAHSLLTWTEEVVHEMGIEIVVHLKSLLPLLSANLAAPPALAYPPLVLSSLQTLQTIMLVAWPRIPYYRSEILTGLTACWCRIEEQESCSKELKLVQQSLRSTMKMLKAVLESRVDALEEYRVMTNDDKRLQRLFSV